MPAPAQPPADLLPVQREATLAYRAIRLWAVPLLHALFRITVEGRERIPTAGAYVLIANHLNWLDSFAILATFPAEPPFNSSAVTTLPSPGTWKWPRVRLAGANFRFTGQAGADVLFSDSPTR